MLKGQGLELEKNVPFKLLNEYIEILGGVESSLFADFRKMFYKYENIFNKIK